MNFLLIGGAAYLAYLYFTGGLAGSSTYNITLNKSFWNTNNLATAINYLKTTAGVTITNAQENSSTYLITISGTATQAQAIATEAANPSYGGSVSIVKAS